jgi:hypothetical protein
MVIDAETLAMGKHHELARADGTADLLQEASQYERIITQRSARFDVFDAGQLLGEPTLQWTLNLSGVGQGN